MKNRRILSIINAIVITLVLGVSGCQQSENTDNSSDVREQQLQEISDELAATKQELVSSEEALSAAASELAAVKESLQETQQELSDANKQTRDYRSQFLIAQNQLEYAKEEIQSYQEVFPLRAFASLSELQGFLRFNAKGWQLDLLDMQQDIWYTHYDYALLLQAVANDSGYAMSVQIDNETGEVFNTVIIDDTFYAIYPQYIIGDDGVTIEVWAYAEKP